MDDTPQGSNVAQLEVSMGIDSTLRNASLDGCKDPLPPLHSSNDNEGDGSHEHQEDVRMSDYVSINGVDCGRAS
jgi:hypothetical protein